MTNPYSYLPDLDSSLPEITEDSIISRSLFKNAKMDVTLFGFAAGQELTEHTSPYAAIIQVLEGTLEITLGGDQLTAQAGAWIRMDPDLAHSLKAATRMMMLLTIIR